MPVVARRLLVSGLISGQIYFLSTIAVDDAVGKRVMDLIEKVYSLLVKFLAKVLVGIELKRFRVKIVVEKFCFMITNWILCIERSSV